MYINRHLRFTRNYNILAYRHFTGHRTLSKNWLCIVQFSCRRLGAVISYDLLVQYTPFGARRWCVTIAYRCVYNKCHFVFCFVLLFVWGDMVPLNLTLSASTATFFSHLFNYMCILLTMCICHIYTGRVPNVASVMHTL